MKTPSSLEFAVATESPVLAGLSQSFRKEQREQAGKSTQSEASRRLNFTLPPRLEAAEPPEARGLARDEVRLMISHYSSNRVVHTQFQQLPEFLEPGDLLVINTSGTLNAALKATRADGTPLELHLSTHLPANLWIVELRQPQEAATGPFLQGSSTVPNGTATRMKMESRACSGMPNQGLDSYFQGSAGELLTLPGGAWAKLLTPYLSDQRAGGQVPVRLWVAVLHLPRQVSLRDYLNQHGFPIRYSYVKDSWPGSYYQTVYATEPGSAEMPSAGRPFTAELMTQLVARGVQVAPLILHTGVASLESHEPPYEEFYRIPGNTARQVNSARAAGKRVIAVGTTVVRALETVANGQGDIHPGEGWTNLVITPERRLQVVDGLLTGLHEPEASHLAMLQALAGLEHLQVTYAQALQQGYLWHEFGDLHLIVP